jgi:hypothetical protein
MREWRSRISRRSIRATEGQAAYNPLNQLYPWFSQ